MQKAFSVTVSPPFHQHMLHAAGDIWQSMLAHPFITRVADGSIPDETFKIWIAQDYLFVEAAIPFMGILIARAPASLRPTLAQAMVALHTELDLFREQATRHGVNLDVEKSPTCHAYEQFLLATAYQRPLEISFVVLYGAEKAYLDSWQQVKNLQTSPGPWQAFIDNWTSTAFQSYVDWLAQTVDELAAGQSPATHNEMERAFVLTARYEYLFWDMALSAQTWPV